MFERIRVGVLVRYVGSASMYRGRLGIVAMIYGPYGDRELDSALVHFDGLEGKGRDAPGLGQVRDGLHPMAFDELEIM